MSGASTLVYVDTENTRAAQDARADRSDSNTSDMRKPSALVPSSAGEKASVPGKLCDIGALRTGSDAVEYLTTRFAQQQEPPTQARHATQGMGRFFGVLHRRTPHVPSRLAQFHAPDRNAFRNFIHGASWAVGHNLVDFDMAAIGDDLTAAGIRQCIDTLPLSALLYPSKTSHALGKPEKISEDALNDPLTDAYKCRDLFLQEIQDYASLDETMRMVYALLLQHHPYFRGWYALLRQAGEACAIEAWNAPRRDAPEASSRGGAAHAAQEARHGARAQSAAVGDGSPVDPQAVRDGVKLLPDVANLAAQAMEEEIAALPNPCLCESANLARLAMDQPVELAYALAYALAPADTRHISEWALRRFPGITGVLDALCRTRCSSPSCRYCTTMLDATVQLRRVFGFESFRTWQGQDLQRQAVQAAIDGESIMAVFPTGGGKSLTFQLPAIIDGQRVDGLTIVISPLQSLMVDQVASLERRGITAAATINGTLDPVQRTNQIERVRSGIASLLYIAPESLRSPTIQRLAQSRNVTRIVVDEAHCFSAWGQDFRVDYWYIGEFIKQLESHMGRSIPVSCFTATAKQQVIADIRNYFHDQTGKNLRLFATTAQRLNLHYQVIPVDTDDEHRYRVLRELIEKKDPCPPTIVFVAKRRQTTELARRLSRDGIPACAFHGDMSVVEKMTSQEAFLSGGVNVMVATKAFGMGIDKSDVQQVIHYTISESLEDYVQESGRAGHDERLDADCIILYNPRDLDVHFQMLNQSRITINQIQQVWQAIKYLSDSRHHGRMSFTASALEIAREAGWSNTSYDVETRVRAALMSLEQSGYITRGINASRVFADSLAVDDIPSARSILERPGNGMDPERIEECVRILSRLLSSKHTGRGMQGEAESRVDYLADCLALPKGRVRDDIDEMKRLKILRNDTDMHAYVRRGKASGHSGQDKLGEMNTLEIFLVGYLVYHVHNGQSLEYKEANEAALNAGVGTSSVPKVKSIVASWIDAHYIRKPAHPNASSIDITFADGIDGKTFAQRIGQRQLHSWLIDDYVTDLAHTQLAQMRSRGENAGERIEVVLSLVDLQRCCAAGDATDGDEFDLGPYLDGFGFPPIPEPAAGASDAMTAPSVNLTDVRCAVLYLERTGELDIEGGFLVIYNGMRITRVETDNRRRYRKEDYAQLDAYYRNRIEQIHLVGRFASMMVDDHDRAMRFAADYFAMDHDTFLDTYISKSERAGLSLGMTKQRYDLLFAGLNEEQRRVIDDATHRVIVVAAGPGSGKTMTLVHKLASLVLLEDTKPEQLLMLTFSHAAAMDFARRLHDLIGDMSYYVGIRTFHAFAFDVAGRVGNLKQADTIERQAAALLNDPDAGIDESVCTKTCLVIDEAQDMSADEYELVTALMRRNTDMRVIAVGDDDQSIMGFRGADSAYMAKLASVANAPNEPAPPTVAGQPGGAVPENTASGDVALADDATIIELSVNYRSDTSIVEAANALLTLKPHGLKTARCHAHSREQGSVEHVILDHPSIMSVIERVDQRWHATHAQDERAQNERVTESAGKAGGGNIAVLVPTNEDVATVYCELQHRGVPVTFIDDRAGFRAEMLEECAVFLESLDDDMVISAEHYREALDRLRARFSRSIVVDAIIDALQRYADSVGTIYRSDLEEMLANTPAAELMQPEGSDVIVSTYHKAKGRQFDTVYCQVTERFTPTDIQAVNLLYVGMTRARHSLVLCDSSAMLHDLGEPFAKAGVRVTCDSRDYEEPRNVMLTYSLRDVRLGDVESDAAQRAIGRLQAGDALHWDRDWQYDGSRLRSALRLALDCGDGTHAMLWSSRRMNAKITRYMRGRGGMDGYDVLKADVGYVVRWHDSITNGEWKVPLPRLVLGRWSRPRDCREAGA